MAELRPLFPGGAGGRRRSKARLSSPKRADRRTNDGMHDLRGNAQSQAQPVVAASNHRPLIALGPYNTMGGACSAQNVAISCFEDYDPRA
jgi:hypothetical protein